MATAKKRLNNLRNTEANQFSKTKQPTPEKKAAGWAKKKSLKELLNLCLNGNDAVAKDTREKLAIILGKKPDDIRKMTFEEVIDMRQIYRAMSNGRDWKALKEIAYGTKINLDANVIQKSDIPLEQWLVKFKKSDKK